MAGSASTLTWNLVANSVGYVAGMGKAQTSTAKFKRELDKAEKSQRNLTRTVVSTVAAAAVVRFGVQSVKAYAEAEKAQARLSEAYRKFPRLANANIESLRTLNAELQKTTRFDDDATAAAQANLAMYDLTGQQIAALTPLVQDLASAMGTDVTDAAGSLGKAFMGNARALKAVGIDFKSTGDRAKDFDTIMGALQAKVGGFAAVEGKTAAGQLAIMNNAVGELQESVGQALVPALTQMVGIVTPAVQAFTNLPAPVRTTALAVTALGGAALIAAPKVLALKQLAEGMGSPGLVGRMGKTAAKFVVIGAAAGAATKAVSVFGDQSIMGGLSQENLQAKLLDTSKALDDIGYKISFGPAQEIGNFNQALATMIDPGVNNQIAGFVQGLVGIDGHLVQSTNTVKVMDDAITGLVAAGHLPEAKIRFEELRASFIAWGGTGEGFDRGMVNATAAISGALGPTGDLTDQTHDLADEWHDAEGNLKSFARALQDLNSPASDLTRSQIALRESTRELRKGLLESAGSFSLATEAGRTNRENLISATEAIMANGAAIEAKTKDQNKAREAVLEERKALIKNIAAMVGSREEARKLVDKYLKVPAAVDKATKSVKDLDEALDLLPTNKAVTISLQTKGARILSSENNRNSGSIEERFGRATGGYISGPGTGTSDSIPARLSNGEYVIRASAVSRYGTGMMHAINSERFAKGGPVRKKSARKERDFSVRDALRGDAGIDFDFTAYGSAVEQVAAATRDLADADRAVFDARRKVNTAGSPAERADAERDLADAYAAQAAANKEVAASERAKAAAKPTGRNILASFRGRAAKLDRFRRDLKTLRSWGLSGGILREIIDSGIDEGGDMAAALVRDRSVIADLNKTQRAINADAAAINGPGARPTTGGGGTSGTTGATSSAVMIGLARSEITINAKFGKGHFEDIWHGLLELKKDKGGAKLHLD